MAEKENIDKIEPVDFDQNESPLFTQQIAPAPKNQPSALVWIALGGLVIVALFVVFVLPTIVSEYELPLERRADVTDPRPATAGNAGPAISPFEEAQRALQRKDAQDVLAELLQAQQELDELQVRDWAGDDYADALLLASTGDDYYRSQAFELARDNYANGRDALRDILETVPAVTARLLIDAQNAMDAGNADVAAERFQLALLLEPDNSTARIGAQRASTLEEVSDLVDLADDQFEDGELEGARTNYRAALNLDSYNDYARTRVGEVSRRITELEFARIMSNGYTLLEQGEAEAAIAAFQRAANVGINQDQALAAIVQAENAIDNVEITRLRGLIATAEREERWQDAVTEYENVLGIDGNLVFAIEGRDYAAKRAQLDRLLVDAIANPARFAEDAVFEQTRDVYFTGRAIENPGPRLQQQVDRLQVLLENSQVPIQIRFTSDNLTEVTLLRVGELGLFESTELSLKPGNYVAVGKRTGYREVREEFTVGFGLTPGVVVVRCDEPVVTTSRR